MATRPPQLRVQAAEFPAVAQEGPDGHRAAVPGQPQPPSPRGGSPTLNPTLTSEPHGRQPYSFSCPPTADALSLLHPALCCGDTQPPSCSTPFPPSHVPLGYLDLSTQRKQETCLYRNFILLRTFKEQNPSILHGAEGTGVFMGSESSLQQCVAAGQEAGDME